MRFVSNFSELLSVPVQNSISDINAAIYTTLAPLKRLQAALRSAYAMRRGDLGDADDGYISRSLIADNKELLDSCEKNLSLLRQNVKGVYDAVCSDANEILDLIELGEANTLYYPRIFALRDKVKSIANSDLGNSDLLGDDALNQQKFKDIMDGLWKLHELGCDLEKYGGYGPTGNDEWAGRTITFDAEHVYPLRAELSEQCKKVRSLLNGTEYKDQNTRKAEAISKRRAELEAEDNDWNNALSWFDSDIAEEVWPD